MKIFIGLSFYPCLKAEDFFLTLRKKFSREAQQYTAVWVEDSNGKNERCWLLTDKDIKRLDYRSIRNKEDWTEKGFLTNLFD
jgi:hypothetical protein